MKCEDCDYWIDTEEYQGLCQRPEYMIRRTSRDQSCRDFKISR